MPLWNEQYIYYILANSGSRQTLQRPNLLNSNSILLHDELNIYSGALGNNLQNTSIYKAPYLNSNNDFRLRFDFT